jgi:hypothetical protein
MKKFHFVSPRFNSAHHHSSYLLDLRGPGIFQGFGVKRPHNGRKAPREIHPGQTLDLEDKSPSFLRISGKTVKSPGFQDDLLCGFNKPMWRDIEAITARSKTRNAEGAIDEALLISVLNRC